MRPSSIPELNCLAQWDGQAYLDILLEGYSYHPKLPSMVAFFPMYPLLGRIVASTTGLSGHAAAWIAAQICLVGSLYVFAAYSQRRGKGSTSDVHVPVDKSQMRRASVFAIVALGFYPPCFFMWMAYSESLFLLLCLVAMLGIQREWRPGWVALVIGAATATRPVGVALLVPFALYLWRSERISDFRSQIAEGRRHAKTSMKMAVLLPMACWGLLSYMAYQWYEFGTPLAFVQTQDNWRMRPPVDLPTKALILASGEPIWSAYMPASAGHWTRLEEGMHPLLSLHFFEPLYFVGACVLVYIGTVKRWLTRYEVLLAIGLLFIPYVTKGYEMTMASQARFTIVVFPIYIVMGQILARMPWWAAAAVLALFATYMGVYAAMWAAGHVLI